MREKCLCVAPAHIGTYTQPAHFFLLEQSLQPTPSPLCGLALWLLLGVLLYVYRRVILDLSSKMLRGWVYVSTRGT